MNDDPSPLYQLIPDPDFPTPESRSWALVVLGAIAPVVNRESFRWGGA